MKPRVQHNQFGTCLKHLKTLRLELNQIIRFTENMFN